MAGSFSLSRLLSLRVGVDRPGQRRAEPDRMRAAVRIRDRVGEEQKLVGEAVVVLHHAIDVHVVLDLLLILVLELHLAPPASTIGLGWSTCLFSPSWRTNSWMPSL